MGRHEVHFDTRIQQSHIDHAVEQNLGKRPKEALSQIGTSLSIEEAFSAMTQLCVKGLQKEDGLKPKKKHKKNKTGHRRRDKK